MKTTVYSILMTCCLFCCGAAVAQEHPLTYDPHSRGIGLTIAFAGDTHVMVKMPVRDIISGSRHSVVFPAPSIGGVFTNAFILVSHNTEALVPNMTISGFPAQAQVADGITSMIQGDGLGGHDFLVIGTVSVTVSIDIGSTILTLTNTLPGTNPVLTDASIGATPNALSSAEWGKYGDRTFIVDELDRWVDYIKVNDENP